MSAETTKVCPVCGHDRFHARENVRQLVTIDGNGKKVGLVHTIDSTITEWIECTECKASIDMPESLVTEAYFHEEIAAKESVNV